MLFTPWQVVARAELLACALGLFAWGSPNGKLGKEFSVLGKLLLSLQT